MLRASRDERPGEDPWRWELPRDGAQETRKLDELDRCVLVLLELAPCDSAMLGEARRLAEAWQVPVHLLHIAPDHRRTGGMEFELADWVNRTRSDNALARQRLARRAAELSRQGCDVQVTFAEGRARETVEVLLRSQAPAAVIVYHHPRAAHRDAMNHGIRRSVLASSAWLVVVPDATNA